MGYGPTDGRTDGRTNGRTDGRTDGRSDPLIESLAATKNVALRCIFGKWSKVEHGGANEQASEALPSKQVSKRVAPLNSAIFIVSDHI